MMYHMNNLMSCIETEHVDSRITASNYHDALKILQHAVDRGSIRASQRLQYLHRKGISLQEHPNIDDRKHDAMQSRVEEL